MSKHTPEPWHAGGYEVQCDKGTTICNMSGWKNQSVTQENARRIVACVNACAGVDTDLLEDGELDKPTMLVMQENNELKHRCDELRQDLQREKELSDFKTVGLELAKQNAGDLLVMLEVSLRLIDHFGDAYGYEPSNCLEYKLVKAAIAKAKGGAA